jgi:hypothetical protein
MIELFNHPGLHDAREHVEIHDHPLGGARGLKVAFEGHVEPVGVPMQPRTFTVMMREYVGSLEFELLANPHDKRFPFEREGGL